MGELDKAQQREAQVQAAKQRSGMTTREELTPPKLAFVRSALPDDSHGNMHASLWEDLHHGGYHWLAPEAVIQYGLGDALRVGVQHEEQHGISPMVRDLGRRDHQAPRATETGSEFMQSDDEPESGTQLASGRIEDWRFEIVRDGDQELVVIDNKPAIKASADDIDSIPTFYKAVIPKAVLKAIASLV